MGSKLKVLPLKGWMRTFVLKERLEETLSHCRAVEPVFKRPGLYLRGDSCWFELEDGRAFEYRKEDFIYTLALLDVVDLRPEAIRGLVEITKCNLATRKQRVLLYMFRDAMAARAVGRFARVHMSRVLKR